MNQRFKKLNANLIIGLVYQSVLIITGFVIPRYYLSYYGSEINGLISSVAQFLSLINICELGIGAVVSSAMYKPLAYNDTIQLSKVFYYAKQFFRRLSYVLIIYVLLLVVFYPTFLAKSFRYEFTALLIISMSVSAFGEFFWGIPYQLLLTADQRGYIQYAVNGVTLLVSTFISVLLMRKGLKIQMVKLVASLIYLARPMALRFYAKKYYKLDKSVIISGNCVPQKKSSVIHHFATFVNTNTDVVVLTLFSSYATISIYTTYCLVTNGIVALINISLSGIQALFGNLIASDKNGGLSVAFEVYNWIIHTVCVLLFTLTGGLIIPFIELYTKGVNDTNYKVPVFAIVITLAYFFYVLRNAFYIVIKAAGHYYKTQTAALVEMSLNIVLSVILVFRFGLEGVACGTLIAEMYYFLYEIKYLSNNIVFYSIRKQIKQMFVDLLSFLVFICTFFYLYHKSKTYYEWIVSAIFISCICIMEMIVVQCVFNRKKIKMVAGYLKQKSLKTEV